MQRPRKEYGCNDIKWWIYLCDGVFIQAVLSLKPKIKKNKNSNMTLKIRKIGQLKNSGRIKLRFISSISGTRLKSLILRIFMLWQGFFFFESCVTFSWDSEQVKIKNAFYWYIRVQVSNCSAIGFRSSRFRY